MLSPFREPFQEAPKIYAPDRVIDALILWTIPQRLTPNHITLFRIIATPAVLLCLAFENYAWGVPLFLFVASTDAIDGALARTRNKVTPWGMFFDPVADKFLIVSSLIILMFRHIPPTVALAVIGSELLIMVCALVWRQSGRRVQANTWGKIKMILQVTGIALLLGAVWLSLPLSAIATGILSVSVVCGLVSLFRYGV